MVVEPTVVWWSAYAIQSSSPRPNTEVERADLRTPREGLTMNRAVLTKMTQVITQKGIAKSQAPNMVAEIDLLGRS
jgi:hypothetical protein